MYAYIYHNNRSLFRYDLCIYLSPQNYFYHKVHKWMNSFLGPQVDEFIP